MGLKAIVILAIFITITLGMPTLSFAKWLASHQIISGTWGKDAGQFDKAEYDTDYDVPDIAAILPDQTILIHDTVNWKMMVFKENGEFVKDVFWQQIINAKGEKVMHLPEYWIEGVRRYKKNNTFYIEARNGAELLSPSGEVITVYNEKPIDLGFVEHLSLANSQYITLVQFEDLLYSIDGYFEDFVRDQFDYLNVYGNYTTTDSVSGGDSLVSYVFKFDKCGKKVGVLNLPVTEYEPFSEEEFNSLTGPSWTVRTQYGPPVIGPDGSVYAYKRTPDTYSILKWSWVDDPSDPQGGPEPPAPLAIQASLDGLLLSWGASPQDPGCVDSYEVERATSSDGIYSSIGSTDAGILKYNDTTILPGDTVYYKVRAKSGGEYSDYTAIASGKRP